MGLDITAYGEVELLPEGDYSEAEEKFGTRHILAHCYDGFEPSAAGLMLQRWYKCDDWGSLKFPAGSYGGYGHWRESLAKLAGYTPPEAWNDPEGHKGAPFFLLVNFADNEGTIGPEAAAELSGDFTGMHVLMQHHWKDKARFQLLYRQWTAAFCLASDGGLVDLH